MVKCEVNNSNTCIRFIICYLKPQVTAIKSLYKLESYCSCCDSLFSSESKPEANSCGASGKLGISAPSGNPSITSSLPPSSNGESPLNILSSNELSPLFENAHI